jgi:hypothetical protein
MQNFIGQDIQKHSFVAQIARTNQGIVKRVGVVLTIQNTDEGLRLRVGWYDVDVPSTHATESVVKIDNLVLIDPNSLPNNVRRPLDFVKNRGGAR